MPIDPVATPEPDFQQLSLPEALHMAMEMHRRDHLDVALQMYERILEAKPDYPDALHYYGILNHQAGRFTQAIELISYAIALQPDVPGMHNNLGNVLLETGRPAEAEAAFLASLALDERNPDALNNLGVAQRQQDRLVESEQSYRRAIACDPTHRDAYNNLGLLLSTLGRIAEAIRCHARAVELGPQNLESRRFLLAAHAAVGDIDKARAIAESWLREDPVNPIALHLLAAAEGCDMPPRASDGYIESAFDRFAATFDTQLTKLRYRAPQLIADAVARACGEPEGRLEILDAGCGTGLCGPLLAPFAVRLVGVDLSPKMLERAVPRNCYAELHQGELTRFMLDRPHGFDVIVSADTLCYFGVLDEVLAAAASALRPGGTLVFSVEAEAGATPVRLNSHGRYSHSRDHVATAIAAAPLDVVDIAAAVLRQEKLEDVNGFVVTARRSGPSGV